MALGVKIEAPKESGLSNFTSAVASVGLQKLHANLGIPSDYALARGLSRQREARRLVSLGRAADDGRIVRVTPRTASAWRRLSTAAAHDGVTLLPLSGFRSVRRQTQNIRRKLAAGEGITDILRLVAAPGYSEHHTGRAIDIGSPDDVGLDRSFASTRAFRWLKKHAVRFGFRMSYPPRNQQGFSYEPWHWCFCRSSRHLAERMRFR